MEVSEYEKTISDLINKPEFDLENNNKVIFHLIEIIDQEIILIRERDKDNLKHIQKPKELLLSHLSKLQNWLNLNPDFLKNNLNESERADWLSLIKNLDEKFIQYEKAISIAREVNNRLLEILENAILNENTKNIAYDKTGNIVKTRKSEDF